MDTTILCIDIAEEHEEQGIIAIEVRRFLRKNKGDLLSIPTVFVTNSELTFHNTLNYGTRDINLHYFGINLHPT